MKQTLVTLMVLFFGLVAVQPAHAAPYSDKPITAVSDIAPSTGTMIAAALETSGYRAQQQVLDQLGKMLNDLGALIVIIIVISGLVMLSVQENYDGALWLLIGPALFWFCVFTRTQASGVEWQSADAAQKDAVVGEVMATVVNTQVSTVFHWWNSLISNVFSNVIKVISNDPDKTRKLLAARPRIMDSVLNAEMSNMALAAFSQRVLGECNLEMEAARTFAMGKRDVNYKITPEYREAASKYADSWKLTNKSLPKDLPILRDFIQELRSGSIYADARDLVAGNSGVAGELIGNVGNTGKGDRTGRVYLRECLKPMDSFLKSSNEEIFSKSYSCEQLWCMLAMGFHHEAMKIYHAAENDYVPTADEAMLLEIRKEIIEKLSRPKPLPDDLKLYQVDDPADQLPAEEGDDAKWKKVELVRPDLSVIPVIISGHLLRRQMAAHPQSKVSGALFARAGFVTSNRNFDSDNTGTAENAETVRRYRNHQLVGAERNEVFSFAMTLPYIQGVFLFVLALVFPFCGLFLLIPGKANVFFSWFVLWAWVKFWDVGWAVVMIVDDLLWSLMPHVSVYDPVKDPTDGPMTLMQTAFEGDYGYSLYMYYALLAAMLTGVIAVSANYMLEFGGEIFGHFSSAISKIGRNIGGSIETSRAFWQLARIDYVRESGLAKHVENNLNKPADKAMEKYKGEIKSTSGWGTALKVAGMVGMAVVVAVAILATPVTMGGSLALLACAGGAWAVHSRGVEKKRLANSNKAKWKEENARRHYFAAGQTKRFRNLDAIRAGLSHRGEFWNMPDAPTGTIANVAKLVVDMENENNRINWGLAGDIVREAAASRTGVK